MIDEKRDRFCSRCENQIKEDDDFCPNCGALFTDNVKCSTHFNKEAEGVCVICCEPYCGECGIFVDGRLFLCTDHSEYETLEGMASILDADNAAELEIIKSNLEAEGFHPFIFPKRGKSINRSLVYDGRNFEEFQLMVPFQEVMRAEEILQDLGLLD